MRLLLSFYYIFIVICLHFALESIRFSMRTFFFVTLFALLLPYRSPMIPFVSSFFNFFVLWNLHLKSCIQERKIFLTAERALEIFKQISDEDCLILGKAPSPPTSAVTPCVNVSTIQAWIHASPVLIG